MQNTYTERTRILWLVVVAVLVAAVAGAAVWLGMGIRSLYRQGFVAPAVQRMHIHRGAVKTLADPSVSQIQSWMTFRYVTFVFHLPAGYLAGKLGIAGQGYLNSTLGGYASSHSLSTASLVQSVKDGVASYQPSASSTTP